MAKRRTLDSDGIWRPKKLKIVFTDEKMTASSGLGPLVDAFADSKGYERLRSCVPSRNSNASYDPMQFVLALIGGFWHGYDCLDDVENLEGKPDMSHRMEGIPSARAIGDFLRAFDTSHFTALNEYLTKGALAARKVIAPEAPVVLDMDGTSHVQSGKLIEGLGLNYKGENCLESLDSFDELGFCYGFRLREGGTFSAVGAPQEIDRIFRHLPYAEKKVFRADSAYCNEDVIRACLRHGATFTITAHGNINWESKVDQITNWTPWKHTDEEIEWAASKKRKMPELEVGSMLYQPSWSENLRFYVVVKRQRIEQTSLFEQHGWKYYGVLTNWNLFNTPAQEVLEHHARRGNAENFIREKKVHLDLKHFPCLKLNANFAYGLIGMVAYNFLRMIAHLDKPDKPHYAKKLREKYIYLPGKVIKHARQFFLKIPENFRKEVDLMQSRWAGKLEAALAMG